MKYKAYLRINDKTCRIFPRSKKTCCFNSIQKAEKALEKKASNLNINSQGLIYENDKLIHTIAL